jgi:hypothetical protein
MAPGQEGPELGAAAWQRWNLGQSLQVIPDGPSSHPGPFMVFARPLR